MGRPGIPPLTVLWAAILVAALPYPGFAAERAPLALANACASCHGTDGRSQDKIPSLAGMPAADFVAKMTAFRVGEGDPTVMDRIAPGVSPTEVDALAAYFASLR